MTREEVKNIVSGISDEQLDQIFKLHGEGITKAKGKASEYEEELKKLRENLDNSEKTISELKLVVDNSEQLKAKLSEYEQKENERKLAQEQELKEKTFFERFEKIASDKTFINELTKNGIYNEFKKSLGLEENNGKGDTEIFESLVKDKQNIFENPNKPQDIPRVGKIESQGETAPRSIPEFF